ncbi:MAG: MotA/TolQ/ExbB proton channel family protein [Parvularculaceae bacterium]|nr:MotA/TolQ/ExbB proton channel family protein [Parvularculaceae bacterium]
MNILKLAGATLIASVAALALNAPVAAQDTAAPAQPAARQLTLDQVLQAVRRERTESSAENKAREERFLRDRNNQQAELGRVRGAVVAAEAESTRLEAVMAANQAEIDKLDQELASKQGEFQELFGAARSAAADLTAQLEASIISAEFPGRTDELREVAQTDTLPTETQLRYLYETMVQQIAEQSKTSTFTASVAQADGSAASKEITRIGPFVAFSDGKYLTYKGDQNILAFLARQPAGAITGAAKAVENASGDGFTRGVIDPSLGKLLGLIVETPSLNERVAQGGEIGFLTLGIGALAFVWGVFRLVSLNGIAGAVKAQARRPKASKSNPLGRVMLAYEAIGNKNDIGAVESVLDEAILKEIPKLESGLSLVKIASNIAPLLGLLGTVIGMVVTFQSITLFGTGDPQIMASGISIALMTTVIGLVVSIPLVILHAFAAGAANRVTQILEEQAAGIIAEHADGRR